MRSRGTFSSHFSPSRMRNIISYSPSLLHVHLSQRNCFRCFKATAELNFHSALQNSGPKRYAVLGAGFAGVALAWNLLQFAQKLGVTVHLFDENGLGGGASGVSGGLLHPYSPKGKLLWEGELAMAEAMKLLKVAEYAREELRKHSSHYGKPICWKRGLMRPATDPKHASDFTNSAPFADHGKILSGSVTVASCISTESSQFLVPGSCPPSGERSLYIPQGVTIDSKEYLQALFDACKLHVQSNGDPPSCIELIPSTISSLSQLAEGKYDAIAVCLGAGAVGLEELKGQLPLTMVRGKILELSPLASEADMLSLLGSTWIASHSNGKLLVGATKEEGNANTDSIVDEGEVQEASLELLPQAAGIFPAVSTKYRVVGARAGVRAIPKRTALGALPLAGCIDGLVGLSGEGSACHWLIGGFGSRGLIYHGLLAKLTAECMVLNDESLLPRCLLEWKEQRVKTTRKRVRKRK